MKGAKVWGIIIAIALIVFSAAYPVPDREIDVSSSYQAYDNSWLDDEGAEYVGGDAYNLQMEASLKAGYMGGVLAMKTITFVGGLMLLFITLYSAAKENNLEEQKELLEKLTRQGEDQNKLLKALIEKADGPADDA